MEQLIAELLNIKLIEVSYSPVAALVTLALKKRERVCNTEKAFSVDLLAV